MQKDNKIIIHNIFEDELYYTIGVNDPHYGIVRDNILYIVYSESTFWDKISKYNLINKNYISDIDLYNKCNGFLFWNNNSEIYWYNYKIDMRLNKSKRKTIETSKYYILGIKKIILNKYEECLITLDNYNNIKIFGFNQEWY